MSSPNFIFDCGDKVKDKVSGFEGIIVAQTYWFTGCNHYEIVPDKLSKDGQRIPSDGFDESRLKLVKKAAVKLDRDEASPLSGKMPALSEPNRIKR